MKRFTVVTILPELIAPSLTAGVVGRAVEAGTITVDTVNPRDFTHDRHRTVDDTPYGGGPGMVMKAEPLLAAIAKACEPLAPGAARATRDASAGERGETAAAAPESFGRRVLKKVEATLTRLAADTGDPPDVRSSGTQVPGAASRSARGASLVDDAALAVADAEATIAELEAQLRGEAPRLALAPAKTPVVAPVKPGSLDEVDAAATLAELEMELGMRAPAPDLQVGSSRGDAKVLGPAIDEDEERTGVAAGSRVSPETSRDRERQHAGHDVPRAAAQSTPQERAIAGEDERPRAGHGSSPGASPNTGASPSPGASPNTGEGPSRGASSSPGAGPEAGRPHRILLSPSGMPLTQARVRELAKHDHLVLVCGRYEGIDQRVIDTVIDEEISIGDYVLSGGELAALVVIDAVARLVPGVLGEATSADDESFSAGLLEYPQYTKPAVHDGKAVPAVLQSGNHAAIAAWRRQQSLERTAQRRPELFRAVKLTKSDRKLYADLRQRTHIALVHHPVVDRAGTVITTAITNFDIHDLARSTMTYGLAGYHIVSPVTSQREKAANIATLWMGDEKGEHRAQALRLVRVAESIDAVIAALTTEHGRAPTVVATSAKAGSFPGLPRRTPDQLVAEATLDPAPLLILLGTGWGLAEALIPSVSRVLAPIEGDSDWNHLSVRSATAIILDRLFGRPA